MSWSIRDCELKSKGNDTGFDSDEVGRRNDWLRVSINQRGLDQRMSREGDFGRVRVGHGRVCSDKDKPISARDENVFLNFLLAGLFLGAKALLKVFLAEFGSTNDATNF